MKLLQHVQARGADHLPPSGAKVKNM